MILPYHAIFNDVSIKRLQNQADLDYKWLYKYNHFLPKIQIIFIDISGFTLMYQDMDTAGIRVCQNSDIIFRKELTGEVIQG